MIYFCILFADLLILIKAANYVYIGCYGDAGDRALRYGPHSYGYTVSTCSAACPQYKYFALQNNGWCCCDDSFVHATKYGPSNGCPVSQLGGGGANDLFQNGLDPQTVCGRPFTAWYRGDSYDSINNKWNDLSGNGYNTQWSKGSGYSLVETNTALNGMPYVSGDTGVGINFGPSDIGPEYTVFHVAKYNGNTKRRIFSSSSGNWLSGFWNNYQKVAYHNAWMTPKAENGNNEWLMSSDNVNKYRAFGEDLTTGVPNKQNIGHIAVNQGSHGAETSDFAIAELIIIHDISETDEYMSCIEDYLSKRYDLPVYIVTPKPSTSTSPTTSNPSISPSAATPSPTDISLPTNKNDLFCGANNDKPTWAAILSLDQNTLNLLQNVKNEESVTKVMQYVMCSEFIYHIVTKNAAVAGPTTAIKLTNTLLTLLKEIESIEDAVGDTADDISQFIVGLMDTLTPDETGIQWTDEWDQDGTIFNPFEKLLALGQFLSKTVCKTIVGDDLNGLITDLAASASITDIKTAFNNNIHTFLSDNNNKLFNDALKTELLTNDKYLDFSFAFTIGMKLCFSKVMTGCITRQQGISINLRGNTQIFESRSMFTEFPVSKIGISSAGYIHFDFLSNYLDIINKETAINVGVFANVPGSDKISDFLDLWESHSDKLDDIPFIGDTSQIGVDFIDGVIEDNPLIVDILTGGATARLSIIYTFTDNDKINCNGFRIALSVGDIDSFGGGVFFGNEYRQNGIGNIQQSMDWIDDVDSAANFKQFGKVIIGLSTELINILDGAVDAINDEIAEIAEDIIGTAKTQIIAALNEVIDGIEDIANVGVDAVNVGIDGVNGVINGANSAVNSLIDDANILFIAAISGANSARSSVNSAIDTSNWKITSVNSAVGTVKSRFNSANSKINTAKNDCKDVDNECINLGVTSVCVNDIINIDSLCNAVFSPVSSPMSALNSAINSIPMVPKITKINTISNSITLPNVPGFANIHSIDDINIADIPNNANQVNLNDMMDDYNYIDTKTPDLTITIPSKVTVLIILYTIILGLIGYFCGLKNGKNGKNGKNNKQRYLSVYDTEITDVSDNDC